MSALKGIAKELKMLKSAAIFAHIKPDGDTLGSAYALNLILQKIGVNVSLFCDGQVPEKFEEFIPSGSFSNALSGENFSAFIAVDSSDEARLGIFERPFKKFKNTFNIDHHISNSRYAKHNLVIDRSSTAEIILELAKALQVEIDKPLAETMLLGIITDTGSFAHKNVTPQTLFSAGELLQAGADLNKINYLMFKKQPAERARLFAEVMSKIRYFENGQIAIAAVTDELLQKYNADYDMTEGFIDFPLSVDTVEVAVNLLQYKGNQFKVSFRSKGKANVNEIAGVFGGGGHILASGCMINGDLETVIDKLVYTIKTRL